jgi:hypothetical protein
VPGSTNPEDVSQFLSSDGIEVDRVRTDAGGRSPERHVAAGGWGVLHSLM